MATDFKIKYDPYLNSIEFMTSRDNAVTWEELGTNDDELEKYKQKCVFQNCVEDIVAYIIKYHNNMPQGMKIHFWGTKSDFELLKSTVSKVKETKGKISCKQVGITRSSKEALEIIKEDFHAIKDEFREYMPPFIEDTDGGNESEREIGELVMRYKETVKPEIPICVIGTYSVGKSTFINAFIGSEILPSAINANTGKNVKIIDSSEYSISITYKGELVKLKLNGSFMELSKVTKKGLELLTVLKEKVGTSDSESESIYRILDFLNEKPSESSVLSEIDLLIYVEIPFRCSLLDRNKFTYCIYDTPGSNNEDVDQEIHKEALRDILIHQTNALPVFLMERQQLTSHDNQELKKLLDENGDGFSTANSLIVISKADQCTRKDLEDTIPQQITDRYGKATILYTSAVVALGEKKGNEKWLNTSCQEHYEKVLDTKQKFIEQDIPKYSHTPCGRKPSDAEKSSLAPMIYASGIPSVEVEINHFANQFAEYKKCVNGRKFLLEALERAECCRTEKVKELASETEKKKKEQEKKRKELSNAVKSVKMPSVNDLIAGLRKEYESALNTYCDSVHEAMKKNWAIAEKKEDKKSAFENLMKQHCQQNLYNKYQKQIVYKIHIGLRELAKKYIQRIKELVTQRKDNLTEESQMELEMLFKQAEQPPEFTEVKKALFDWKDFILNSEFLRKKIPAIDEWFYNAKTEKFCKVLRGDKNRVGLFSKNCIEEPVEAYYEQLNNWGNGYIKLIDSTLEKENAFLSQNESEIKRLEKEIHDLELRLRKLDSVKKQLETILVCEEK